MTKALVMITCLGIAPVASADPAAAPAVAAAPTKLTSEPAKALIRGLKLAGAKSTKAKTKTTWTAAMLGCTTTPAKEVTELDVTECQADAKKFTGAAAFALEAGMTKAGIVGPYMMGKTQIRAASLTCTMDETSRGEDGPFVCSYTPVGR